MMRIAALILSLFVLTSCGESGKTLKVAATAIPHAELLEQIQPELKEQGINLQIIVVEDYNTPNRALSDKDVDANFFQHRPFLDMQMKEFGYKLEPLAAVHIEPMGLYTKKHKDLKLAKGASIAVPVDPTNQARALLLLEQNGLVRLKKRSADVSVLDVEKDENGYKLYEIDSPLLARALEDVDLAAITTNFALQSGLNLKDALAVEDRKSPFVNIVVVREGDVERADVQALKNALTSEKVREYINTHYDGVIFPAF